MSLRRCPDNCPRIIAQTGRIAELRVEECACAVEEPEKEFFPVCRFNAMNSRNWFQKPVSIIF